MDRIIRPRRLVKRTSVWRGLVDWRLLGASIYVMKAGD
jgi:hypothetical protein